MSYLSTQKKHTILSETNEPELTTNEALSFLHSSQVVFGEQVLPYLDASEVLAPNLDYPVVKRLCLALKKHRQISCHYYSKTTGLRHHHLSPHCLVKIDSRYHLRAYSHDYGHWGDFVIGRFLEVSILPDAVVSAEQDVEWNTLVTLCFELNPELDEATQTAVRWEWNISDSQSVITINTRKALQNYAVRKMTCPDYQALKPLFIHLMHQDHSHG